MFGRSIAEVKKEPVVDVRPTPPDKFAPVTIEEDGSSRGAMIRAARAFDETQRELALLHDQLHKSVAGLEAKNGEINELRVLLAQERNNVLTYQNERDRAFVDRADALAVLANIRTLIEHSEIPLPTRRRRNGKTVETPTPSAEPEGEAIIVETGHDPV